MDKSILIDTNVVFRYLENDRKIINILNYYKVSDYRLIISDHSLFEIIDYLDRNKNPNDYEKLKYFLFIYRFQLLYRKQSANFNAKFLLFLNGEISLEESKKLLIGSFKFSLSSIIKNIYSLIGLAFANSLTIQSYKTKFYSFIKKEYKAAKIYKNLDSYLDGLIKTGYIDNKIKISNRVKNDLKDIMVSILCYYNLYKDNNIPQKESLNREYNILYKQLSKCNYKTLLKSKIKPNSLLMYNKLHIDDMSYAFISNYIDDLLNDAKLDINDMVDFLNFSNAYNKNIYYFTLDKNSLKKYKKYFTNDKQIIKYIDLIEKIENVPYNVIV